MEDVMSWIKHIFILSILSNVITHLMPSSKYTKYASYICGLLIIMVCIMPPLQFLRSGLSFDKIYDSVITYDKEKQLKQELTYREGNSAQTVLEEYEKEIAETVEEHLLEKGYYPAKTEVETEKNAESSEYGSIKKVYVVLSDRKNKSDIVVEDILVGSDLSEQVYDFSEIENEIAQLLHITLSCVKIKQQ